MNFRFHPVNNWLILQIHQEIGNAVNLIQNHEKPFLPITFLSRKMCLAIHSIREQKSEWKCLDIGHIGLCHFIQYSKLHLVSFHQYDSHSHRIQRCKTIFPFLFKNDTKMERNESKHTNENMHNCFSLKTFCPEPNTKF